MRSDFLTNAIMQEIMRLDAELRALDPSDPHRYRTRFRNITERIAELTRRLRPER